MGTPSVDNIELELAEIYLVLLPNCFAKMKLKVQPGDTDDSSRRQWA